MKHVCREQKQEHNDSNHSPSHLPTSTKQWCQWLAKTKTDWLFSRPPRMARTVRSFWCCCSWKANQRYGKDALPEDQSHWSSESSNIGNRIQLKIILSCFRYTLWEVWRSDVIVNAQFKKKTYLSSNLARQFYEHRQVSKCGYKCGEQLDSTWIHIRPRSQSRAKFNNEKTFSATERTVVAVYVRSSTTERQPDYFQRVVCLQSCNSWELVSTDKLVVWQKKITKPWKTEDGYLCFNCWRVKQTQEFWISLQRGTTPVWTWHPWKIQIDELNELNERREQVQKLRLCFNCFRAGHMSQDCKSRTCSVPTCGRRHNRLLHSDLPKEKTTENVSDDTTAVATNINQGGLPVVRMNLTNIDLSLNILAMCDSGSSISFVDKSLVSKLSIIGVKSLVSKPSISVVGIHGSQDVKTEIVPIAVSAHENSRPLKLVQFYVHKKLKLEDQIVELQELKDRYPHLRNLPNQSYNLNDVQVILGQDCYDIHHPFEFKKSEDKTATWAVKSKIVWALSGPLPAKQAATLATTATSIAHDKLANQDWWDIESYVSKCDVRGHSNDEQWAIKTVKDSTIQQRKIRSWTSAAGGRNEVAEQLLLCNGAAQVPRTMPTERRDDTKALSGNHWTDVNAWYVRKVDQTKLNENRNRLQWYLSYHSVIHPHKPGKVRRVCNAAAKNQGVSLNDILLSGPNLLQILIEIIFRFREHQIALSADIKAMFLQVAVTNEDSRCLQFLWREDPERIIEVHEYTRHVFGAKCSPTCANYALHQVAKENAVNDESLVRTAQRKFYSDYFLKSVRTPQKATEIYQKVRDILIKGGFNLTKWITSDEEVKSHIPETYRLTKVVKTLESGPQWSPILGLNWNLERDSLIANRGTEQEVLAKITQGIVLSFVSAVLDPLMLYVHPSR